MDSEAEKAVHLVRRIREGDAAAETDLVARYATGMRLILLKRTGNPQLAQDLVQDTFIIALQKLRTGELRKPESLAAFLRQTAVNLSIEYFRKEKRYVRQADGIIALHTPHRDMKSEELDQQQARKLLNEVLNELAVKRDREILQRYYLYEEDKSRICHELELTAAHFDRVLYRAKQRMSKLLTERKEVAGLLFGSLFHD